MSEREDMVVSALEAAGITEPGVLAAMRKVPRERFVLARFQSEAYANRPLPIGCAQTISQPYIVAAMTEAAAPQPADRCLEIGTGSGYQAAILAEVCRTVHTIEYLPEIARFGESNLRSLGYGPDRVIARVGDGYQGWPECAPFDVILVTAAPQFVPPPLLEQLALGGRLVIPVGSDQGLQMLELWTRKAPGMHPDSFDHQELVSVRFVPFLGIAASLSRAPR